MNNIWKRSLSMFLAVVMVFGMLPVGAFAEEVTEPVVEETSDVVPTEGESTPAEGEDAPAETETSNEIISEEIPVEEAPVTYAGDNWYWSDDKTTLYIKDGQAINFAAALNELYSGITTYDIRYGSGSKPTVWRAASKPGTSQTLTAGTTYYAGAKTNNYVWTSVNEKSFVVAYYAVPTVTVTGKDGVTASNVTPTQVLHGGEVSFTLPAMGETGWVATVNGNSTVLNANTTTTVTAKNVTSSAISVVLTKEATYKVNLTNATPGYGTASVDVTEGINGATVTVTATPNDPSGAYAYHLVSIVVDDTAISGNTFTINGADVNVVVTFGRSELEANTEPKLEINGYHTSTDYSARFNEIKKNVLNAVLKNGYTNIDDYNLHIWIDPIAGDARYFDWDDDRAIIGDNFLLTSTNPYRFPCDGFGDTVFATNLKVKIIDKDGRTVESTIAVTEWRKAATITPGSIGSATFNNLGAFLEGIKANMTVVDRDNNNIDKSNVTVSDPVKNTDGTYTVTAQVTEAGPTWLPSEVVTMGPYTFKYTQYTAIFLNDDGEELYRVTLDNESTPEYKGTATADLAAAKNDAQYTYTFAGWSPAISALAGADVTYTATYTSEVNKYTITWVNGDETTTETYEYGATPTAPTASKTSTAQYHFTNGTWGTIATVTGDATYTATFTKELRSYTITWVNGDKTTTTTVAYGETPVAPAATKSDKKDEAGNVMATYTNGTWGTIASVTGEATYTATFDEVPKQYTVTWDIYGEEDITADYKYGTLISAVVVPENPDDYVDTDGTNWEFNKWDYPENVDTITGDVTITAEYKIGGNVAKIVRAEGEVYYATLQLAVADAADGETVVLLEDIELNTRFIFSLFVTDGKAVTVDGDGHKLYASTTNWGTGNGKHLINVNCDNITLKDIVLDCSNNVAQGVNVYKAQNIVFDNVTITNTTYNALTINGSTLTVKTKLTANRIDVDLGSGVTTTLGLVAEEGAILDVKGITFDSAAYPNTNVDGALATDGTSYFSVKKLNANGVLAGYSNSLSRMSNGYGYVLLEEMTVSSNITLLNAGHTGTLDLNGYALTVASGKALTVNGALTVTGGKNISGLVLGSTTATITAPAGLNVTNGLDKYDVQYDNGKYFLGSKLTFVYGNGDANDELIVPAEGSLGGAVDPAWEGHLFAGWEPEVNLTPDGNATYTAQWNDDADKDGEIDGSEKDPFWTVTVDGTVVSTTTLNGEYATPADPADQDYKFFIEWNKVVDDAAYTITFTSVWNTNDANNNNVDDNSETGTVTLVKEGNGNVTLTPAGNATLLSQNGNVYTYLYDSTDAANKVINVSTSLIDTDATDGNVDYLISAPATVNVGETLTVKFGTHTLNASNGTVGINGYWEGKGSLGGGGVIFDTLKADTLTAAGITGDPANYTVVYITRLGNINLDDFGYTGKSNFFLSVEVPETGRQVTITDKTTGVSKTVTMNIEDSRAEVNPTNLTVSEQKDLGYMTNDNILADVKAVVGDLALGTPAISAGSLPANAGDLTSVTYTVKFDGNETYEGATITITYEKVYKAYNDCFVSADSALTANGSLTVNGTAFNGTDAVKVPGNSDITVTVKPNSDKIVESITVNGVSYPVTYNNQSATATFKSNGATVADEYVVSATYSNKYLNLKADQTIVYCVDDQDHTYDLQKLVFEAIYGGSSAPMTKDNTKLEFKYGGVLGIEGWADVSKDPAINLGSLTHKFGEKGSETIRLKYSDAKYGSFEQTVVLNVFDSCYNVTVGVETIANGANASIKTQYSEDARTYLGVNYFKQGTSLTVTLTPDGAFLDTLKTMYNGTYADSMAYIKSVTVYDKAGNVVPATLVRDQGKLSLEGILGGVNPMLYNAAVTFDLAADEAYTIKVEYGILKLEKKNDNFQMEMYQGGKDYAAEVPSAQELINAILGEAEAAAFLATYGGAYTVEFSTDLINYSWTAVSDEALLALNDGTEIVVRVTWKATDGDKTYYPVAVTSEITLVDLRTPTSVEGTVPTEAVEYVDETKLIANLKKALGLNIMANGSALETDYVVTYTIDKETNLATVTVTYDGSADYKPTSKTFENVPVADIPDNATIKVTIQNASDVITNNDGTIMALDPATGIYTVIGNGTYNFKFTPVSGKAIESVKVNGAAVELTYNNGVATFSMNLEEKKHYDVVVETIDSVFVLHDERVYDFAYGVMDPVNKDIVDAAVAAPIDGAIDYENVNIEYLAREEGTVTVELPDIDLGFTVIELGTFDIDLGELWLDPNADVTEYDMEKLLDELVAEVIDKVSHGELAATDVVSYMTTKLQGLTIGAHIFGSAGDGAVETIRISYADDKFNLAEVVTDVTIHDYRTATEIVANDCTVTFGYSLEQLIAASGAYVSADGAAVNGLAINTNDLYLHANAEAQQVTLTFAGDVNYQPSEITINVIVNKAACDIDYDSQIITYGDAYDLGLVVTPTVMPDGTAAEIDRVEFMIGLDMHSLLDVDIEDKTVGIDQAIAYIQLRLPKSIRELPLVGQYLQGEFTLGEFTNLINSLSDVLGIDEGSMDTLNQVVEAITGITDNMEIKIIVKDEDFHPTNIGVYVAGAVTVDADFETAYTADYLIIKPQTIEAQLAWDYVDENGIMTLPVYQEIFSKMMGAHVVENDVMTGETLATANGHIKYLILGVNDETSEFLTTDIYGNIKANIYVDNADITDNGAYVQIAYMLNWGNDIYYAMPIVRSFVIVPQTVDVQLVGMTGEPNNDLLKEFNNEPQGFSVVVTNNEGETIYSDHYQNVVPLPADDELTVTYIGLQTNTQTYNSTEKPVHAGAYAVVATYVQKDENGNIQAVGADMGVLVIEPTTSTVTVEDKFVEMNGENHYFSDMVEAGSTVAGLKPDTTIISAGIKTNGEFSEDGWNAVEGNINIDFPEWMDELLAEHVPSVKDGITAAELKAMLTNKLPDISAELTELGATAEVINSLNNLVDNVNKVLAEIPDNATLTFQDNAYAKGVGAYVVVGVVTDSDHYPSADAGILVISPVVTQVELKWNYEDENGIFTRDLLDDIDLLATAYEVESGKANADATAKITYQFVGINSDNEPVIYTDPATLPNGVYVEIAYIELKLDGNITVSDLIARPVVIVASNCNVNVESVETVFDNTAHGVTVTVTDLEGNVLDAANGELTVLYAGMQTNGKAYLSNEAPVHAGVYEALVTYTENADGELRYYGANAGYVLIDLAQSSISVTGDTVEYDGNGHTASVVATGANVNPDYTLISGGAYVSGDIDKIGVDAFHGNVNIDFPRWLDAALAEYEFKTEGVDTAYLIDFIGSYRDDLVAAIPVDELVALGAMTEDEINAYIEKLDAYIDELLAVLAKLPKDVALTFNDNVTYTEPGYYFYYGIVTDSDHYPSSDTGLLVIEKKDIVYDLIDTTVTWDGEGHMVDVNNPNNADAATVIIDRENNTINILVEQDAQYLINTLARILDVEFDGDVQMSTIIEQYNGEELAAAIVELIAELETLELSEEIQKALAAVKAELETLPANGTVTINGELPSEVGEYEVYAISYSEHYKTVASEAVLKIVPVQVEVILDNNAKVYGEADPELTYTVNCYDHEGNILADNDAVTVNVTREAGEDVGTYAITAEVILDEAHYVLIAEPEDAVFEITPADLTITLNDQEKVYGAADPELTYTVDGLVNGDTAEDLNIVVTRERGEDVGTYAITATAENANYNITIVDATLTIGKAYVHVVYNDLTKTYGDADPAVTYTYTTNCEGEFMLVVPVTREAGEDVGTYVVGGDAYVFFNDNIEVTTEKATLTITKAQASVDVNDVTKVYGDADPEFTAVISGLKFEDELDVTFTREAGENVGEYVITATASDDNYDILFATGTLTITKAKVTVTMDDQTKVYGDEDPNFSYTYETDYDGEFMLVVEQTREAGEDVGTYEINPKAYVFMNDNFDVEVVPGTLTITKASVTITIESDEITYGEATPDVVLTYSNDAARAEVIYDLTWNAPEYANVGTYSINFVYKTFKNWNVNMNGGSLTVVPADVTVTLKDQTKVYGETDPELTYDVTGLVNGDTAEDLNVVVTREAGENVGTYAITATAANDNYNIKVVDGTLTITKATVTVTVNSAEITYGEKTPAVELTYSNDAAKAEVVYDLAWNAPEYANVGTYSINFVYKTFPNWNVNMKGGSLTVVPAAITSVTGTDLTYNGQTQATTLTVIGVNNEVLVEGVDYKIVSGNEGKDVGTYTVTIEGMGNYTGTYTADWTIAKATVTVTINSAEITYGDKTPAVTLTYSNELAKDEVVYDLSWNAPEYANVGTYSINFVYKTFPNWNVNMKGGSLTVVKKAATITVDDKTMIQGNAVPELTAVVTGTVNGDTLVYTLTTEADGKTYGDFEITAELGENPNYDVTVVPGTLTVTEAVARINDVYYAKLSDAIAEVKNGETIVMLTRIDEDVTIKQQKNLSFTIDGDGNTYTGTMTINGNNRSTGAETLTITGVNFVADTYGQKSITTAKNTLAHNITVDGCSFNASGDAVKAAYGIYLMNAYNVNVKNATGENLFDLVYGNRAVTGFAAENITVTNSTNGIWLSYVNSTATFKNVNLNVDETGIGFLNNTTGTATIEDCTITGQTPVYLGENNDTKAFALTFNGTNTMTSTADDGNWLVVATRDGMPFDAKFKVIMNDAGLDMDKTEGLVAKIDNVYYNTLQYAVEDAETGDTVTMIRDVAMGIDDATKTTVEGYAVLVYVEDKDITLDMNGKELEIVHLSASERIYAVVCVEDGASLTVTGDGAIDVTANETTPKVAYMFWKRGTTGEMVIENGSYHMNDSEDSMVYTNGNGIVTVEGGTFILDTVGTGSNNGFPWIFNAQGANVRHITVTGGTYNYKIDEQYWAAEVYVPEQYAVVQIGENLWTVLPRVVVTFDDVTVAYGGTPEYTYTVEDWDWDPAEYDLKVETPVVEKRNVGTYEGIITANATVADGYYVEVIAGDLTVVPAQVTINVDNKTIDVDDPAPELTYTITNNAGVVTEEELGVKLDMLMPIEKNAAGQNVIGEYPIVAMCNRSDNYEVTFVNGSVTVVLGDDYVCWNMQTGEYYWIVAEALAEAESGHTVQMLKDTDEIGKNVYSRFLSVAEGVTFDLNQKTVKVDYLVGYNGSNVIDPKRGGVLDVPTTKNVILSTSNSEMSLWNGEGYIFGVLQPKISGGKNGLTLDEENDLLTYRFNLTSSGVLLPFLKDINDGNNTISVLIRLTWDSYTDEGTTDGIAYQNYVYNDVQVSAIANGNRTFVFNLEGYRGLTNLTLTAYVVSETGVEKCVLTHDIT